MHKPLFLLALLLLLTAATAATAQSPATGQILGHDYVDLGLSVMWATCNIGASSPSDYGDYFAWGEAETKSSYTESNSATYNKSSYTFLDAASAQWGSAWRMPTLGECKELIYGCKWERTTIGGHSGYKVTGSNGNSIFLPAAAVKDGTLTTSNDTIGLWSSSPYQSDLEKASIIFSNATTHEEGNGIRYFGFPVRPIADLLREKEKVKRATTASGQIAGHDYVDLGLSVAWATCNIGASSPEDYGNYYAWGEAQTKTKYTKSNSTTYKKSNYVFQDAATVNWGLEWRMPTYAECEELVKKCTCEWKYLGSSIWVFKVTGPNGRSIFFPASGQRSDEDRDYWEDHAFPAESWGCFWSSSQYDYREDKEKAIQIIIYYKSFNTCTDSRFKGLPIRPVTELNKTKIQ